MGLALGRRSGKADVAKGNQQRSQTAATMNTAEMLESKENGTLLPDLRMAAMLLQRVRCFTDGAVIGSRAAK